MTIRPIPHKDYFGDYYIKNSQTQRPSSISQSKKLEGANLLEPTSFFLPARHRRGASFLL